MCYPCSENKGADQLRGYREADPRLCFRICRLLVFSRGGSYTYPVHKVLSFEHSLEQMSQSALWVGSSCSIKMVSKYVRSLSGKFVDTIDIFNRKRNAVSVNISGFAKIFHDQIDEIL